MRHSLFGAVAIVLTGCADPDPTPRHRDAEAPPAHDIPAPRAVTAAATPSAVPPASAPAAPATAATKLALDGEGLRLFDAASGAARRIPFGTRKPAALSALTAVQAAPPREQGENVDCRATFATWANGLTAWFAQDRFVGWSVRPGSPEVTTASGLTVGSSRADLDGAYNAKVAPSSLGVEFTAGGLAGLLDSARPDARVTHLWAGATCIAR